MNEETKNPSGEPSKEPVAPKKENVVDYSSYQKAVSEAKAAKERARMAEKNLEVIRKAQEQAAEDELNKQGKFEEIAKLKESELLKTKQLLDEEAKKNADLQKTLIDSYKLDAVKRKLPARLKRDEYQSFIDLDSVLIDPDSGNVDETSIDNLVAGFVENHSSLLDIGNFKGLPSDAPKSMTTSFSSKEWSSLSLKEKKEKWDRRPKI